MKPPRENGDSTAAGRLVRGVEVTGEVLFRGQIEVEGKVTGKMVSEDGVLIIGQSGVVAAQVDVPVCIIRGVLEGNASAKSRIELHRGSRVRGDLTTPVLLIEEGAVLDGNVGMSAKVTGRALASPPPPVAESAIEEEKPKSRGA